MYPAVKRFAICSIMSVTNSQNYYVHTKMSNNVEIYRAFNFINSYEKRRRILSTRDFTSTLLV